MSCLTIRRNVLAVTTRVTATIDLDALGKTRRAQLRRFLETGVIDRAPSGAAAAIALALLREAGAKYVLVLHSNALNYSSIDAAERKALVDLTVAHAVARRMAAASRDATHAESLDADIRHAKTGRRVYDTWCHSLDVMEALKVITVPPTGLTIPDNQRFITITLDRQGD